MTEQQVLKRALMSCARAAFDASPPVLVCMSCDWETDCRGFAPALAQMRAHCRLHHPSERWFSNAQVRQLKKVWYS